MFALVGLSALVIICYIIFLLFRMVYLDAPKHDFKLYVWMIIMIIESPFLGILLYFLSCWSNHIKIDFGSYTKIWVALGWSIIGLFICLILFVIRLAVE